MKTKTLFLTLISLSIVVYAINYQPDTDTTEDISHTKSNNNSGIVQEMYFQSNDGFLGDRIKPVFYTTDAVYLNINYSIFGIYEEWILFFLIDFMNNNEMIVSE
ncbi:MAG: hypothetical protein K8R74_01765 [Bacteroidales bacterium]|nr:hypothetical protein [Bacteroidales bacterium]